MTLTKVNRGGLNTGISDSSDATFLTVDSSEQAVIKSEGGAVTTSVQQGLAKHWAYFNMAGTSFSDSFNASSLTDNATGVFLVDITSAFSSTNYAIQFSANCYAADTWQVNQSVNAKQNWGVTNSTSKYDTSSYAKGSYIDSKYNYSLGHGDLA